MEINVVQARLANALKEWTVIVKALGEGMQTFLLRKGGILDTPLGEFRLKHGEFLLYPTLEHQRKEDLKPEYWETLDVAVPSKPPGETVNMEYWAEAVDIAEVHTPVEAERLYPYHAWSREYVENRMNWRSEKPLKALFIRTYRLENPLQLEVKKEYAGCKSWVPLLEEIPGLRAVPVLSDEEFHGLVKEIKQLLH